MSNKCFSINDIVLVEGQNLNPNLVIENSKKNKITIYKPKDYKIKKEGYEEILNYKNTDILSTSPPPNHIFGEVLIFFPNTKALHFLFLVMHLGDLGKVLSKLCIKYLSPEKFPCSFFLGHIPELPTWKDFTEESFLGYPTRSLSLNSHLSKKKFKFHTETIID